VEVFKKYAEEAIYPVSTPFFISYKYIDSFFKKTSEKSNLIKAMQSYYNEILLLRKENSVLKNQLNLYRYIFKSYNQFSHIPTLEATIAEVKFMMSDIFITNTILKNAYAIDSNGNFVGILRGDKLYTLYSRNFKCKIKLNGGNEYGVLERTKGIFKIKYLRLPSEGEVFVCDKNLQIPIGKIRNKSFHPYFTLKYIPKVVLIWENEE
jgi:hypothetical protein